MDESIRSERVLNGDETNDIYYKPKIISEYLMKTIGIYSRDDIKNNFDFILYDINNSDTNSLDDRRKNIYCIVVYQIIS